MPEQITTAAELDALHPWRDAMRREFEYRLRTVAAHYAAAAKNGEKRDRDFIENEIERGAAVGRDLLAEAEARGAREALLSAANEAFQYGNLREFSYWLRARAEQAGGDR